jgi:hypothetical protein
MWQPRTPENSLPGPSRCHSKVEGTTRISHVSHLTTLSKKLSDGGSNPLSSTNNLSKFNNLPNFAKFDQLGELGISRILAFWKRKSYACSLCPS